MHQLIVDALPDIPRVYTALAEWSACLVYVLLIRRRLSRPGLAIALAAGLAVLVGVQLLAGRFPIALWTAGISLAGAVMFALAYLCADVPPRDAGYFVIRAFVLAELVASLQWQLYTYSFPAGSRLPTVAGVTHVLVVYAIAFTVAWFLERRHFSPERPLDVDRRGLLSAAAIAIITFLMSNLSFVDTHTPFSGQRGMEIFYIRTLVDLAGYVALYAQQGQRLELRRAMEVDAINRILHSQHEQYLQSKRNIDVVNRKYHDLKHYITAIRSEPNAQARAGYLDQLEESITGYGQQVQTGSTVLDTLLTAKSGVCAEQGITLTCVVDGAALVFMSAMDLSALFGNALDNAIEAAVRVPDRERRLVKVAVYVQDSFVMASFENYFEESLEFDDGLPRTTKADVRHHGYGLKNMRQIAESYGGTLTVQVDDGWFVARVLLPVPAATVR